MTGKTPQKRLAATFLAVTLAPLWANATETVFTSLPHPPQLVELYTSEGCSSCPPADQFLATLSGHPDLYQTLFPLAFHVDYWDYLGWKDRFSQKRFSQRQRRLASMGAVSQVYTPGFVVNGQEWRAWFRGSRELPVPAPYKESSPPLLRLVVSPQQIAVEATGESVDARPEFDQRYSLHLAVTASGLVTDVSRGENRGRQLRHDFVVIGYENWSLSLQQNIPWRRLVGESVQASLPESTRLSVVAWVTDDRNQPITAVGGYVAGN